MLADIPTLFPNLILLDYYKYNQVHIGSWIYISRYTTRARGTSLPGVARIESFELFKNYKKAYNNNEETRLRVKIRHFYSPSEFLEKQSTLDDKKRIMNPWNLEMPANLEVLVKKDTGPIQTNLVLVDPSLQLSFEAKYEFLQTL